MAANRTKFEILETLQEDARISNKQLAARVGLAPSSCLERVRKLEESGCFRGFHAELNPKAVGLALEAIVAIRLSVHTEPVIKSFYDYAVSLGPVMRVFYMAGREDFLVHVAVKDTTELRNLILENFAKRESIDHIETSIVYESRRSSLELS